VSAECADAVPGGGGEVRAERAELFRAGHGAHAAADLDPELAHADRLLVPWRAELRAVPVATACQAPAETPRPRREDEGPRGRLPAVRPRPARPVHQQPSQSAGLIDVVDDAFEEASAFVLAAVLGVVPLADQDGEELGPCGSSRPTVRAAARRARRSGRQRRRTRRRRPCWRSGRRSGASPSSIRPAGRWPRAACRGWSPRWPACSGASVCRWGAARRDAFTFPAVLGSLARSGRLQFARP
jgi:hypothetical protein